MEVLQRENKRKQQSSVLPFTKQYYHPRFRRIVQAETPQFGPFVFTAQGPSRESKLAFDLLSIDEA
ncbi:cytoskeletal protein binding protein [Moniliophthora roreri]|nr:cytoskeletal protein binding protein [Moniliophthora roreri]